ncbi:MAG: lipopolysaccharide biosynthesis protein [Syntrophobacteraceae bacterium]|nr:lipopolysaccharide biosynthesis protein [Syntrophobacteraceae bacterium]
MDESLRSKTAVNLTYNAACRLLMFLLSSATSIVLARNLSSSDYGIVGFASIFVVFLGMFNDIGVTDSIIQKKTIGENELYTAFTLKVILGLLIFAVSFGWGSLSQRAFDNPAVRSVIVVLSTCSFINALGFLPTTLLSRELKFKRLTVPQIGGQVVATAVAIGAAYMGLRYWSLVLGSVASCIASTAIVIVLCPTPIRFKWDPKGAAEHLRFGSHLFLAWLLAFVLFNSDNFIIGAVGGAAMLGFYSIAFNWGSKACSLIDAAVRGVLLATFSRLQHETERLKRGYLVALEYVGFAAVLANVLLFILSRELLTLVLGGGTGKWLPALTALRILCVYGGMRAVLEPVGTMVTAIGRPSLILKSNAVVTCFQVACLYPALKYLGLNGVALVVTFSYALQVFVYFPVLRRELGLSYPSVFRSVRAALLAGCALTAFGAVFDRFEVISWFSLATKLGAGTALYLVVFGYLTGWKIFQDAREIRDAMVVKANRTAV